MWGGYSFVRKRTFNAVLGRCSSACVKRRLDKTGVRHKRLRDLFRSHQQHGYVHTVTDFVSGCAVKNVADETVSVCCHGDEINVSFARELDDFIGGFAKRQNSIACETFFRELTRLRFQIRAVVSHLIALGEFELLEIPRDPAVGHVDQKQLCASYSRERSDVRQNGLISDTVLKRNEDVLVHSMRRSRNVEQTIERFDRGLWQKRIQEQFYVEQNDNCRRRPSDNFQPGPISKLTHFRAFACKSN